MSTMGPVWDVNPQALQTAAWTAAWHCLKSGPFQPHGTKRHHAGSMRRPWHVFLVPPARQAEMIIPVSCISAI